jgi:uroporphyrinogen III methyltransferase/synthase
VEAAVSARAGIVYLVGGGPGVADLLTVRGRDLINSADVVGYERRSHRKLSPRRSEESAGPAAFFVGARDGRAASSLTEVRQLLVDLARDGQRVVYLTHGDPFVFGRGSDLAQSLNDSDVRFEIVPGIAIGSAASTYAGIPLMSPTLSASAVFVNGREAARNSAMTDWSAIARAGGTVVVRDARRVLPSIVAGFALAGVPGEISVAAITHVARASQRVLVGTLGEIEGEIQRALPSGVLTLVIGWTVLLRDEVSWFERRPLSGKRIAIANPRHGFRDVSDRLRDLGAHIIEVPEPRVGRLDLSALREEIERIDTYEWVVLSSPESVATLWDLLLAAGRDSRALSNARIAAIGPATAARLLERGITVDVTQDRFSATALADVLSERSDIPGAPLLYIAGEADAESFTPDLEQTGASVSTFAVYRELAVGRRGDALRRALSGGRVDLVLVMSPVAAENYLRIAGEELAARIPTAAHDAATAAVLRDGGADVVAEPAEAGPDALVDAVRRRLATVIIPP